MVNRSEQLKTHEQEPTKTYIEYDAFDRPARVITARFDAVNGEVAVCTEYAYDGSSSRAIFQLEYHIAWQSAWDILPIPPTSLDSERT